MRKMKRIVSISIAVMMAFTMISVAYARYAVIANFDVTGDISASSVNGQATAIFGETVDATVKLTLERSSNGGTSFSKYRTLASKSKVGKVIDVTGEASGLSTAYDYRIKAEVFVYNDSGNQIDYDYEYVE